MVCLQIINLLPEYQRPQILTQEFDDIQCVRKAWPVPRESVDARQLKSHVDSSCWQVSALNRHLFLTLHSASVKEENFKYVVLTVRLTLARLENPGFPASDMQLLCVLPRPHAGLRAHLQVCKPWVPFRREGSPCMMPQEMLRRGRRHCTEEGGPRRTCELRAATTAHKLWATSE